ncbi:MAG: PPC domain-containing protein [Planctomycetes bacterium]|nr:PPC domain-containing protein [Planctomycetota bacterium]
MRSASLLAILLSTTIARADLPSPRFDRLLPMGAAAGSSVEVEISGADIEDAKALHFDHPGLKAEFLKDKKFKITVAADVPAGTYDVRFSNRFGISNSRLFQVSKGLIEVAEKEPNDEMTTAQVIAVNSVVNGTSDGNREDVYRFPLKQGQRVTIECQAQKLDSQLDGTLTLFDAMSKQVASNGDWFGRDPLIDFVASTAGDYYVSLSDLTFRGGLAYRLLVTDQPHVESVFPGAVQVGKPAVVTLFGRNLGPKAKPSKWKINDLALDELAETVTIPADISKEGTFRFTEHPATHAVLPTASTSTVTGMTVRGIPVLATDIPVTLEAEPNDDPKKPQALPLPVVLAGRFDQLRDADWYEIEPKEDGAYAFDVYCERIAGRADPYLVVLDDKDNRVGELDDFGMRTNAFDGHLRDPSGSINLAKNRKYRVLVQDRYRRGGARFMYVLSIRKNVPDFYAVSIHAQNPGPAGATLRKNGAMFLDILIQNKEGFNGPITITAEGLPRGVHSVPTIINGDTKGAFVLWADADAADGDSPIKLFATGKNGDATIKHEVRPYNRIWSEANIGTSRPIRELTLAIREPAPYSLKFATERIEIEAGKKTDVKLQLERIWPEFKGNVNIIPLSLPNSIKMGAITISEGKTDGTVTFDVQANTKPGEYTITVLGQGQVPFSKDVKATTRPNTLVASPSRPITVMVSAAAKK